MPTAKPPTIVVTYSATPCPESEATLANPNRFKNKRPQLLPMPTAAWINPPTEEKHAPSERVSRTLN